MDDFFHGQFALEHGLAVVSADTDFSRFSGLRLENPLT